MKNRVRSFLVITLSLLMALSVMTGCGAKPTAEDAEAYVKAMLDYICTGDYDHSVKMPDFENELDGDAREALVKDKMAELAKDANLSDEVVDSFSELMLEALSKTKYSIVGSTPADDGYDVTVSIEPLKLFAVLGDSYEDKIQELITDDLSEVMLMSEEEQTNYIMGLLIDLLKEGLKDPEYGDPIEVTVHYGIVDDEGHYGCTDNADKLFGTKLFSDEGI